MPIKQQPIWTSGINPKSSMSYERYLKSGLEMISKHLSLRAYKLAPKDEYPSFQRGKDLRVGFFWKGKPIVDATRTARNHEIIVELSFWYTTNKNKEDREYMRSWADLHLKDLWMMHETAKTNYENKMKSKKVKKKTKKKVKKKSTVGSTQVAFEKEKRK